MIPTDKTIKRFQERLIDATDAIESARSELGHCFQGDGSREASCDCAYCQCERFLEGEDEEE